MPHNSYSNTAAVAPIDMDVATCSADRRTELPGNTGIWVFVLVDLIYFALLFLSFVIERSGQAELFATSRHKLDIELGLVNTLLLLTSSWLVVLAVKAARAGEKVWISRFLMLAIILGLSFTAIKFTEYRSMFSAGYTAQTNDFFMFYFLVTAIHLVHVVAGMVVLTVISIRGRHGNHQSGHVKSVEIAAIYWHVVDLLWVMIFPLIYLSSI